MNNSTCLLTWMWNSLSHITGWRFAKSV